MPLVPYIFWNKIPVGSSIYTITLHRNGHAVLFTDSVGESFRVLDNEKEAAALALLERGLTNSSGVINQDFTHREGAIDFIFVEQISGY